MSNTTVVNLINKEIDVYIGRLIKHPHHYGNPFFIGIDGDRESVINKFDLWIRGIAYAFIEPLRRKWILKNLEDLRGKRLG